MLKFPFPLDELLRNPFCYVALTTSVDLVKKMIWDGRLLLNTLIAGCFYSYLPEQISIKSRRTDARNHNVSEDAKSISFVTWFRKILKD